MLSKHQPHASLMQTPASPPAALLHDTYSLTAPTGEELASQAAAGARGRAIGALFLALFGAAWLSQALMRAQWWNRWTQVLLLAGTLLLVAVAFAIMRRTAGPARQVQPAPDRKRVNRLFVLVNVLQWAAVIGAVNVLAYWHRTDLLVVTIAFIVGVHMFPLAQLFRYAPHHLTGALLVGWAGLCLVLFAEPLRDVLGCAGTGLILWSSAARALFSASQQVRLATRRNG